MADIAVNTFDWRKPTSHHTREVETIPAHILLKIAALELRLSELSEQVKKLHAEFHHHEHESVVKEVAA
jgi:hypothetical protein